MNRLKIILFLILMNIPLIGNSVETYKELRISLAEKTALYYKNSGSNKKANDFRPFLYSAIRVANMFPMYPAQNTQDRMLRLFELGGLESFWSKNFIVINIPGAKYSNGQVKKVSVDYSAWGVNEDSVRWTYAVAKAIQNHRPIPKNVGDWYPTKNFLYMCNYVNIPQDFRLRKIDLSVAQKAKEEYYKQKIFFRDPEAVRKVMEDRMPKWEENTQDDMDSALVYRVLEELDRKSRKWKYGHQLYSPKKHDLYRYLYKFIDHKEE